MREVTSKDYCYNIIFVVVLSRLDKLRHQLMPLYSFDPAEGEDWETELLTEPRATGQPTATVAKVNHIRQIHDIILIIWTIFDGYSITSHPRCFVRLNDLLLFHWSMTMMNCHVMQDV